MNQVEEGVANFRQFQLENREFMGWFRSEQEQKAKVDKRRSKVHFALLGLLIALVVTLFGFLLTHFDQTKHVSLNPFAASSQQDAGGPEHLHY